MDKYEAFKKNVNELINIDLNYYKEKQMKRRISSLLSRNNFKDFDDYFIGIKKDKKLLEQFINYLTINVSEFYRNPSQWDVLEKDIIPSLMKKNKRGLKVWSAACSTGEEPYSLVMMLSNFFPLKDIKILATDLDDEAMNKAKLGLYSEKSLANLPKGFKEKYFNKIESSYKISDDIKKCVEYKKMDLLKDRFPSNIDLIACRNVMIYFTEDAKELLYSKFYNSLSDIGILFVGSTEQIIMPEKHKLKAAKTFFYEKII
ncbi:CheR family methyltransferase [Tissierella praeacuta]|uniref:CheR family methyltransferase n=1 Tax=Tissierella praeacuta TaxID=43131 RepID=UPI0010484A7F|nr:protein-glutamate O-methyltransferase CheR [Tissierella praeacuta]MBU5254838.1 protein-glutamate O-methyltransferase CheR [Tissierella praeacuta]TCU72736.1 CheR-type MCP methyltransferase [Tissierella praeacuta]